MASKKASRATKIPTRAKMNLSAVLIKIFLIAFTFCFIIIIGGVIFANDAYDCTPVIILLLVGVNILLMCVIYRVLVRHTKFLERRYSTLIASGLLFFFVANVAVGFIMRYEPAFDLGAIFTGASQWASTGEFMNQIDKTCDPNYFYYFPNNLGGMSLLFIAFKAVAWLGITDYYAIAMMFNALLAAATVLLITLICKRLFGVSQSVMVMIFVLMSPPFYFIASTFYTDSLSMVFPVLIVYLYLRYLDSGANTKKRVISAALLGLSCAVGMLVKYTVIIALIAVILYHICTKGFRSILPFAIASIAAIIGVFALFNAYFYSVHIDKDTADRMKIPYSHWIMMSLYKDGRYNTNDYEFTRSFKDPSERETAILEQIKLRVKKRGVVGMLKLFNDKGVIAFGDGTFAQSDFLDDNPANDTFLHSLALYDGEDHETYRYVCSGIYFSLQLLMLVSALNGIFIKKQRVENVLPMLCVFGIMLFLMMWEVTGRYGTNYIPMIMISAVSGLDMVTQAVNRHRLGA